MSECYLRNVFLAKEVGRFTAFSVYDTTITMDGKRAFKSINQPSDLFNLPTDPLPEVLEGDAAAEALKQLF